jgi:hypothetical protein
MRTKLFIGSASAIVLTIAAVAFAGAFNRAQPTLAPEPVKPVQQSAEAQPCCTEQDCYPE